MSEKKKSDDAANIDSVQVFRGSQDAPEPRNPAVKQSKGRSPSN